MRISFLGYDYPTCFCIVIPCSAKICFHLTSLCIDEKTNQILITDNFIIDLIFMEIHIFHVSYVLHILREWHIFHLHIFFPIISILLTWEFTLKIIDKSRIFIKLKILILIDIEDWDFLLWIFMNHFHVWFIFSYLS